MKNFILGMLVYHFLSRSPVWRGIKEGVLRVIEKETAKTKDEPKKAGVPPTEEYLEAREKMHREHEGCTCSPETVAMGEHAENCPVLRA